jgi:DNA-binding NarL/FixJ family response regulator
MKILVADDHVLFREGVRLVLTSELGGPLEFFEAGSHDEVLSFLGGGSKIDLAFLDLWMPGTNGILGIENVRALMPTSRLIVMSAFEDPREVKKIMAAGVDGFFGKSAQSASVIECVRQVVAGHKYVSPSIKLESPKSDGQLSSHEKRLTQRQCEVLYKLQEGKSNKEIARELGLAEITVKLHVTAILRAFGAENRTQVVVLTSLATG